MWKTHAISSLIYNRHENTIFQPLTLAEIRSLQIVIVTKRGQAVQHRQAPP